MNGRKEVFRRVIVWLWCAVAALSAPQPTMSQVKPQKYALLIGINEYLSITQIPSLKFAKADALALEEVLKQNGYQVIVLTDRDAEREKILRELNRLSAIVTDNDTFLLFFAGHGVRNKIRNDKTYLLTRDAELDFLEKGIRLDHLMDFVSDIKASRKLVLLDHCFSGDIVPKDIPAITSNPGSSGNPAVNSTSTIEAPAAIVASATLPSPPPVVDARDAGPGGITVTPRNVEPPDFLDQLTSRAKGLAVLAAARQEALEMAELKHGIFTSVLLRAFNTREADTNGDGKLQFDELRAFVGTQVSSISKKAQTPVEMVNGVDLNKWNLTESLPIDDVGEATQKVTRYKAVLDDWYRKTWIDLSTKVRCKDLLDKWISVLNGGPSLERVIDWYRNEIVVHIDNDGVPEDLRAKDLKDTFIAYPRGQ